jgi:hypothetical protein
MMSSSLLDGHWGKDALGDMVEEDYVDSRGKEKTHYIRERDPGFKPGDYIYRELEKKVPLYLGQSLMLLKLRDVEYEFLLMDHLAQSGSEFDPFRGLVQARRKGMMSTNMVVAGGHMPGGAVMTTPDATYVAPGWFSDYDSGGKANMKRVPLGGQAVVLFPDKKVIIPASTFVEATDVHTALMLNTGLTASEKEKLLGKTK